MKCENEQHVIEATRSGGWTSSLRAHLQHCPLCAQTQLIAASLQEDAANAQRRLDLPPAGMVWRRAQARRREAALERATRRPFLIVSVLGALYSMVFLLWGIFQLPPSVYRLFVAPPGLIAEMALAGAAFTGILAIVGSFVLVLETEKPKDSRTQ